MKSIGKIDIFSTSDTPKYAAKAKIANTVRLIINKVIDLPGQKCNFHFLKIIFPKSVTPNIAINNIKPARKPVANSATAIIVGIKMPYPDTPTT